MFIALVTARRRLFLIKLMILSTVAINLLSELPLQYVINSDSQFATLLSVIVTP